MPPLLAYNTHHRERVNTVDKQTHLKYNAYKVKGHELDDPSRPESPNFLCIADMDCQGEGTPYPMGFDHHVAVYSDPDVWDGQAYCPLHWPGDNPPAKTPEGEAWSIANRTQFIEWEHSHATHDHLDTEG